ncbi:TPA: glucose-1-phosphatase [Providencia stuartii]|uniref:Glucose-1-phosphatase n=3 Tax=Providencia stuartii TaxID=588 RepID=A0AAJ1JK87_PROST|nr:MULTISPECIES: glucose-1-phosphatase [Providencia]SST03925.1 putative HAD superfamily hydrolase [Acinetobacter baumannii]AFH93677.1 alpha-D-glucose-1-phosphatase [Providencia stuartii MRSN 2154]AIN64280.1 phosphatase yihX [Providencia stuartii]AMG67950.1 glucose-1-phosphatase [Providencia stuartii]APG51650.1 glucose-1-phosphatase [Providencia stuartii]
MLYIFDMGNVIIDIDFNRVFDKWSELSGTPSEQIKSRFTFGNIFQQHECGKISDIEFAEMLCEELGITLSFEEFAEGWHAIFMSVRPEVIDIMERLREQGHRVVVLSNTNRLHLDYWPEHYPEIAASSDFLYLSQDLGMRKPDPAIYQYVLESEEFDAADAIFFDDVEDNIKAAEALGIKGVHVVNKDTVPEYFRTYDFNAEVE